MCAKSSNLNFGGFSKESFYHDSKLTLDWHDHEGCGDADETGIADFLVENVSHDQGGKRCRPHVMNKDRDEIESIDIVGY